MNFFVEKNLFLEEVDNLSLEAKEKKDETIIVDYVGANAGKPLHIGHLCTPSTGQTFINMFRHLGYNVIGDTHFGDWGGIFGQIIYSWKNEEDYIGGDFLDKYVAFIEERDIDNSLDKKKIQEYLLNEE